MCTKGICKKLYKYFSYAVSTTGKRLLTLFDVVTDVRTFLILWNDSETTSISYLLLASISTPMLVYWASSHNFNEAISKTTSKDKKLIVCIGSLYNVGNILNKN